MSEPTSIIYFCPGSCEGLATEQARKTGEEYYEPSEEDPLITAQTGQQQDASVTKTQTKPEPGTVYSLPATCQSGDDTLIMFISPKSITRLVFHRLDYISPKN